MFHVKPSTDDDGNETETTTYKLDGNEVDSTTFTTFYNKLVNMAGQKRLTEAIHRLQTQK